MAAEWVRDCRTVWRNLRPRELQAILDGYVLYIAAMTGNPPEADPHALVSACIKVAVMRAELRCRRLRRRSGIGKPTIH